MSINGVKERRHQPFWDTLIRGNVAGGFTPRTTIAGSPIRLFTAASTGNVALTNMEGSGAFPSDQSYRVLALRTWLYFRACTGGGATDHLMYHHAMAQLFWELVIQNKQAFTAPTFYLPAGGGLFGDVGSDTTVYFNNGVPSQESICKLARSIAIPARQNFLVNATVAALGSADLATDITGLTAGEVSIGYMIDGLHVRDVL
jgi:hypothetical protein